MNELEYALETIDGGTFEDLSMDFLRSKGYEVHESGRPGRDGGWDARIQIGSRNGIAHASTHRDWRPKLRQDAQKVAQLEKDRDENYNLLIFVTNEKVTGQQELDLEDEIYEKYSWKLQIFHRDNLLGELRQNLPDLADRYLDVDLGPDHDHRRRIEQLRDERIEAIRTRNEHAANLPEGSAVTLHVIPNGLFSQEKKDITKLPNPPAFGGSIAAPIKTLGQEKLRMGRRRGDDEYESYSLLRNNGLYEATDWSRVVENNRSSEKEEWINASIRHSDRGLDASVVITIKDVVTALRDAGFSGVAFVSLSILDAPYAKLSTSKSRNDSLWQPPQLGKEVYTTNLYQVPISEEEILKYIEPVLSEVWRECGYEEGTKNIEDGEWARGSVSGTQETLLKEGDR